MELTITLAVKPLDGVCAVGDSAARPCSLGYAWCVPRAATELVVGSRAFLACSAIGCFEWVPIELPCYQFHTHPFPVGSCFQIYFETGDRKAFCACSVLGYNKKARAFEIFGILHNPSWLKVIWNPPPLLHLTALNSFFFCFFYLQEQWRHTGMRQPGGGQGGPLPTHLQ